MLKRILSLPLTHLTCAGYSLQKLIARPLALIMTTFVIAIALTLPTLFYVAIENLKQLNVNWQQQGHIVLYLKKTLSEAEQQAFLTEISKTSGVMLVNLKSAAEGLRELEKQENIDDIMHYLPENPLPATLDIVPATSIKTPLQLNKLFLHLKAYPEVDTAYLDVQWIKKLYAFVKMIRYIAYTLTLLLATAVVLIITNTLRLAIHNHYEEIKVLKLIGATDAFIARPFLYSSLWYSVVGAIEAIVLVNSCMYVLSVAARPLYMLYHMDYTITGLSIEQAYLVLVIAITLGLFAAKISIKRQLDAIEP